MITLRTLASLAGVNVVPLVGIFVLGWRPPGVLVAYLVETTVALVALGIFGMRQVTTPPGDTPFFRGAWGWTKAILLLLVLLAVAALPIAGPFWYVADRDPSVWALFGRRDFLLAQAAQLALSILVHLRDARAADAPEQHARYLSDGLFQIAARWLAMYGLMFASALVDLGPVAGGVATVLVYAVFAPLAWFAVLRPRLSDRRSAGG